MSDEAWHNNNSLFLLWECKFIVIWMRKDLVTELDGLANDTCEASLLVCKGVMVVYPNEMG